MTDTEAGTSPRFDPRFHPAFQPGYDQRLHRHEPPRAASPEPARADLTTSVADDSPRPEVIASGPENDHHGVVVVAEPSPAQGQPRRLNPYLVVLGLIGVALVVAGWRAGLWASESLYSNNFGESDRSLLFWMQSAMWGAPMVGLLGLACLISIVVILAARWQRD